MSHTQWVTRLTFILLISLLIGCGGGSNTATVANDTTPDQSTDLDESVDDDENTDESTTNDLPNILFILSDDQGLDASAQYTISSDSPTTPTIDQLAAEGITFDNAWATPACTTTRGTIITGKYGVNSGISYVPAKLDASQEILQQYLKKDNIAKEYQSAVFGKWHLGGGNANATHPNDVGVDYYAGNLSNVADYYNWSLTVNGVTESSTTYHTTHITDLALTWINNQTAPWFVWLAYSAPHEPYHLPPLDLHSRDLLGTDEDITDNKRSYYLAAVEAMDSEIGRLLETLPAATRDNTIIIFMGDNGSPKAVIDTNAYQKAHSKNTLFQGGVAVPLVISGKGVTRNNERESALVTATDLYATIAQIAGSESVEVNDSYSFKALLSTTIKPSHYQETVYTFFGINESTDESMDEAGWSVRNDEYKYINYEDGTEALYDISTSFSEKVNLLPSTDDAINDQATELKVIGVNINTAETND